MKTRKLQLLLHPLFIVALACLLLNDFFWKYEYPNWLTGKLSDFTGLLVLSVFLSAFFPVRRSIICLAIGILFTWWKTPLSQAVIDSLSNLFSISIARTVDYSDYVALPVVFVPYFIKTPEYKVSWVKKIAVYFISVVCLVAFCSTSIIRKFTVEPDFSNRISYHEEYKTRLTHEEVMHRLDSLGWSYKTDSFTIVPLDIYGGSLLIRRRDSIDKNWMVIDPSQKDTVVYVRINERRPYIAIQNFKAGSEIFPQVNIAVNNFSNKTTIRLETVYLDENQLREYYDKMSKTKIRIRKLLQKELISKLN